VQQVGHGVPPMNQHSPVFLPVLEVQLVQVPVDVREPVAAVVRTYVEAQCHKYAQIHVLQQVQGRERV